ncbi:MAG: hypothetical protein HOO91_01125 [Bacteroidales bacterium]|nr:hypothetical protein [Bacteroidales bacterium]
MKVLLHIATFACFFLIGCTRTEGTLDIRGKILDEYTEKGIPQREVIIKSLILSDNKYIPSDVGRFCTDSSGHFSYKMKKNKGAYLYKFIFVGDSDYAISSEEIILPELEKNSKYLSFYLTKLIDFTIKIERCSKTPLYDTLYVSWKTNDIDGTTMYPYKLTNLGVAPENGFRWIGGKVKSVIETKTLMNKKTIICWELLRNGKKKEILDTILCEKDVNNCVNFRY